MPPLTLQSKFKNVAGSGRGRAVKNRQSARIPTKWVFKGIVETFSIIGMVGHRKGVRHCKPGDIRGNHFADSATLTAKKVAAAAAAEAAKRNWDAFCIAVVGPSGDLVYFEKLEQLPVCVCCNLAAQSTHGGAIYGNKAISISPNNGGF
jgi:predicted outer membrane repeat protein